MRSVIGAGTGRGPSRGGDGKGFEAWTVRGRESRRSWGRSSRRGGGGEGLRGGDGAGVASVRCPAQGGGSSRVPPATAGAREGDGDGEGRDGRPVRGSRPTARVGLGRYSSPRLASPSSRRRRGPSGGGPARAGRPRLRGSRDGGGRRPVGARALSPLQASVGAGDKVTSFTFFSYPSRYSRRWRASGHKLLFLLPLTPVPLLHPRRAITSPPAPTRRKRASPRGPQALPKGPAGPKASSSAAHRRRGALKTRGRAQEAKITAAASSSSDPGPGAPLPGGADTAEARTRAEAGGGHRRDERRKALGEPGCTPEQT